MTSAVKNLAKGILSALHIRITRNQEYDYQAYKILQRNLKADSNGIDVGCHEGEFLDFFLKFSPAGSHFAFEPLPPYYENLQAKYGQSIRIFPYALSNEAKTTHFNFVKNAPAFSGLKERSYNTSNPGIEKIEVKTERLDNLIPTDIPINFIKIDVEGAEFMVLQGASQLIKKNKPLIIFEFGIGASDYYNTKPEDVFDFFASCDMKISLMKSFLSNNGALSISEFSKCYNSNSDYYFIAHP
ncbi:MAG: hypothetical protein CVU05_08495 [Bacteroidetes bacterium HGW-Bacteroidetes-21]|nr:MAG: hypothetical protein CVU05_08495 [Bacteroidetes bacterium HGW-Bacteroidetes-21]